MEFSALNALVSFVAIMVTAVVAIAQTRKISREQFDSAKKEWADIATLRQHHIETLEARVGDLQEQVNRQNVTIARVQTQAEQWNRRNAQLYELIKGYRDRLAKHGETTPDPNGEEI